MSIQNWYRGRYKNNLSGGVISVVVKILWGVKVMHLIDWRDLFKIGNFSFGWNGDCNGFV
jgi:hypothetical protein